MKHNVPKPPRDDRFEAVADGLQALLDVASGKPENAKLRVEAMFSRDRGHLILALSELGQIIKAVGYDDPRVPFRPFYWKGEGEQP